MHGKTALIALPLLDLQGFMMPSLGIPQLSAYLKNRGHNIVTKNIDDDLYDTFFSKPGLAKLFTRIRDKTLPQFTKNTTEIEKFIDKIVLPDKYLLSLFKINNPSYFLDQILNKEEIFIELISEANTNLKNNPLLTEPWTRSCWKLGILIITLAYYPLALDHNYRFLLTNGSLNINDLLKSIEDTQTNFLIDYYKEKTLPWLLSENPQLIGLSIMLPGQFSAALTLSKMIREKLPKSKLIIGGVLVNILQNYVTQHPALWEFFDFMCSGPGEYTLEGLIYHLNKKTALENIPNLIYRHNDNIYKTATKELSSKDLLTPDFEQKKPGLVLPLQATNSCYWHRCKFCVYSTIEATKYAVRPTREIIKDIKTLIKKHAPAAIFFVDGSMPPKTLRELSQAIIDEKISIKYIVRVRAEKQFLDKNFCQKLADSGCIIAFTALEFASPRILKLMNKGIEPAIVSNILQNFHQVGIMNYLHIMLGAPTETKEDILLTKNFILSNQEYLTGGPLISPFIVWPEMPILEQPAIYKIKNARPKPWCQDLPIDLDYEVEDGLTPKEINSLAEQLYLELNIIEGSPMFNYFNHISNKLKQI